MSDTQHRRDLESALAQAIEEKRQVVEELRKAEGERDALAAHQADLVRELSCCQGVLHSLARSGEVTREYADDAKAVLKRTKEASLARLKAEWQAEALHTLLMHPRLDGSAIRQRAVEIRDDYRRQAEGGES